MVVSLPIGILLQAIASISPLLTFAALWQVKEWRIDRLRAHMKSEGVLRQLSGITRPALLIAAGIGVLLDVWFAAEIALLLLASMSVVQVLLGKQRKPVWTKKALILVTLGVCANIALSIGVIGIMLPYPALVLCTLVLLQPLILLLVWLAFLPIDVVCKKRIVTKAQRLLAAYNNATVIGITGSVGKTTTKELLAHILSDQPTLATPAYVNSEMGVAQWLLQMLPKYNTEQELLLVIEMGAYCKGEIKKLCAMTKPRVGIISYIGSQHLALFGSKEKLREAKQEIVEDLPEDGTAIVNGDCEPCLQALHATKAKKVVIGTGGHADLEAFDIEETATGILCTVDGVQVAVPLYGTHNVTNVLLAMAAAKEIGIPLSQSAQKLQTFTPPSKTFFVQDKQGVTVLDDTHNASPASFRAAITWAKGQPAEKKILLTPGLIELGTEANRIQRELGMHCNDVFDRVIVTGKKQISMFQEGYKGEVESLSKSTMPIEKGSLLVCIGRVSQSHINHILPNS